jgi:toxin YoeB
MVFARMGRLPVLAQTDKKTLNRINWLIQDTQREPFSGIGAPEALKHNLTGCRSRRMDKEHRFVYKVEKGTLYIVQCRYHY